VRARLRFRVSTSVRLPHSRIATPLDLCHFARLNVDIKRAAWAWKAEFRQRHNVVPWAERKSEPTLTVRGKRRDCTFLVSNRKDRVRERRRGWSLGSFPNRPGPDRTEHNDSLDAGTSTGFSIGKGSIHQEEREKQRQGST
jgi:hypothetical protein